MSRRVRSVLWNGTVRTMTTIGNSWVRWRARMPKLLMAEKAKAKISV